MRTLSLSTSHVARIYSCPPRCEVAPSRQAKCSHSAFSFPQLSQMRAGIDGRFHVLHCHPFERAMGVVLAAEQVGRGKAKLGQARAIGAAADDVVIRFESSGREGLASKLHRTHVFAQPVSHVAILFANFAMDTRSRFGDL